MSDDGCQCDNEDSSFCPEPSYDVEESCAYDVNADDFCSPEPDPAPISYNVGESCTYEVNTDDLYSPEPAIEVFTVDQDNDFGYNDDTNYSSDNVGCGTILTIVICSILAAIGKVHIYEFNYKFSTIRAIHFRYLLFSKTSHMTTYYNEMNQQIVIRTSEI